MGNFNINFFNQIGDINFYSFIFLCFFSIFCFYLIYRKFTKSNEWSLFCKEQPFYSNYPFPFKGTPDKVWFKGNKLVVDDFKNRNHDNIYYSDRVQLSLYKILLENNTGKKVIAGYIVNKFQKRIKIEFLSKKELIKIYKRYKKIKRNPSKAKLCMKKQICHRCVFYNKKCYPEV